MIKLIHGNCLSELKKLEKQSIQCVVTSPPYWGLRNYNDDEQVGMEVIPGDYVEKIRLIFKEIWRVLKDDGVVWLNLGDTYVGTGKGDKRDPKASKHRNTKDDPINTKVPGFRSKNLIGIPWRVAFALQEDGWNLRQDIIWEKPNAMPEPVKDRCTKAHEYIFLLSKSKIYYFDNVAIQEAAILPHEETRNKRSIWSINTQQFKEAHFASFPPELPELCIKASTKEGDTVLDPFAGAGTTGLVADRLGRNAILMELNKEYCDIIQKRITGDAPMFVELERF